MEMWLPSAPKSFSATLPPSNQSQPFYSLLIPSLGASQHTELGPGTLDTTRSFPYNPCPEATSVTEWGWDRPQGTATCIPRHSPVTCPLCSFSSCTLLHLAPSLR